MPNIEFTKDTIENSEILGNILIDLDTKEPNLECTLLAFEWSLNKFWAGKVSSLIPRFEAAWEKLGNNSILWSDADGTIQRVECINKKVITNENYIVCRDDNTYVFILDSHGFHARTCWRRTKRILGLRNSTGWDFVEKPSVNLYKQLGFELKYRDFRDPGYGFSLNYPGKFEKLEGGFYCAPKIANAYTNLLDTICIIEDEEL